MLLRFVLILLPISVAIAQDAAPVKTPTWGPQAGPWRLSISTDKSQYSVGETIEVAAVLKNVSAGPVVLSSPGDATLYGMDVRLPMPEWIPWRPRASELPLAAEQLRNVFSVGGGDVPAGREHVSRHELSKLFDMTAPGEYHVTFSTNQATRGIAEGQATHQNSMVKVTSNEITITVLASGK